MRRRSGLTQKEMARLLSISQSTLSRIERAEISIPIGVVVAYSLLLDCDLYTLTPDLSHDVCRTALHEANSLLTELEPVISRRQAIKRDALEQIKHRCQHDH